MTGGDRTRFICRHCGAEFGSVATGEDHERGCPQALARAPWRAAPHSDCGIITADGRVLILVAGDHRVVAAARERILRAVNSEAEDDDLA